MIKDYTPRTSSWAAKLPPEYIKIGVSLGAPKVWAKPVDSDVLLGVRRLAPGSWFRSVSGEEYRARYFEKLAKHDPHDILDAILTRAGDRIPVLCCFEGPPPDWRSCHRGYISAWFADTIGLKVYELGHEHEGYGWSHPKVNRLFRVKPPAPPAVQTELAL